MGGIKWLLVGCAVLSAPSLAQEASKGPVYDVELEVAPQWATATPFNYDSTTEATAVSVTFSVKQELVPGLNGKLSLIPAARLDSDRDDPDRGSSFGIGGELSTRASKGFSAFASTNYKASFTDVLGKDAGKELNLSAGVRFSHNVTKLCPVDGPATECTDGFKLTSSLFYSRSNSSDDSRDQDALQFKAGLSTPVFWWARFDLEGTAAKRWFRIPDPLAAKKQRREDWALLAGLDLAPLIKAVVPLGSLKPWLRKVKIAYSYLERDSNLPGKDKTASSPSFSLVVGREF